MASLTRSELKDIVKECILEIFMEGIKPSGSSKSERVQEVRSSAQTSTPKKHLDSVSFANGAVKVAEQAQGRRTPMPAVSNLAAEFPKDQRGMMQQIFEDTAKNTLPTQLQAERSPGAATALRADAVSPVSNLDPMSVFGGSSNWADLAFSPNKK